MTYACSGIASKWNIASVKGSLAIAYSLDFAAGVLELRHCSILPSECAPYVSSGRSLDFSSKIVIPSISITLVTDMVHLRAFVVCLLGPVPTYGHFILQNPKSHGFVDVLEGVSPCGSFEITDRETVTPWFIAGSVVDIVTTHDQATWSYKAALLNDTSTWIDLQPGIRQQGMGDFCLPAVPGPEHWIDLDGVVQVIQHADDGDMYQVGHFSLPRIHSKRAQVEHHLMQLVTDLLILVRCSQIHREQTGTCHARLSKQHRNCSQFPIDQLIINRFNRK